MRAPDLVRPAHLWTPPHAATSGPECADLAASCGMDLDAEQRMALDVLLAEKASGEWATFEAAIVCARQNLKTFVLRAIAIHRLFLLQDRLTVWTAHEFPTAIEAFRDITEAIEGAAHLSRKVKTINNTNGEEGVELHSGARLIFRARSKRAGRGLSGNTVILDEAFALMPHHLGSLLPTLSAVPNSQVLYGSSAGHLSSSTLRAVRDRGRAGDDPSLTYLEWCAPTGGCSTENCDHRLGTAGCALDDEANWLLANPALGRRITYDAIRAERRALPLEEFARERMGWWEDPPEGGGILDLEVWGRLFLAVKRPAKGVVHALELSPGRASGTIGVAWQGPTVPHVQIAHQEQGTGWIVPWFKAAAERTPGLVVALDKATEAASFIPALTAAGLTVVEVTGADRAAACGGIYDRATSSGLTHDGDPALAKAWADAVWKVSSEGVRTFSRRAGGDISALYAPALALHVLLTDPPPPPSPLNVPASDRPDSEPDLASVAF